MRGPARFALGLLCAPAIVLAADHAPPDNIVHLMANLAVQLAVIIFAARLGGILAERLRQPSVLGELIVGIIIGPFLLGGIPLPGFPHGLFPLPADAALSVSKELYAFAAIASVILLFMAGLETDLSMLMRFSATGLVVGLGGAIASFLAGGMTAAFVLGSSLADPRCLFMGIISTATSVGITIRVLSDKRRVDSPEGVTVLAAAVIDDVLGIIVLAVVLGFAATMRGGAPVHASGIARIAAKALVVWLGFTALGLAFAHKISAFLKMFKGIRVFSVLALGLALLLAGIFEKAGLAMIIGAYVMGLTLSKTDLKYVISESMHPLYAFFVPLFFTVTGMLVNVRELLSPAILAFGALYAGGAILSKVTGCGIPALFLNFNRLGALRIGLGMSPRCEVAIIITGIGLSYGILDHSLFGVSVMMVLCTTILTPVFLNLSLNDRPGTRKQVSRGRTVATTFNLESPKLAELLATQVLQEFRDEGFFIHTIEADGRISHIRKESTFVTLYHYPQSLRFETAPEDARLVKTAIYEALVDLHDIIRKVKHLAKPAEIGKDIADTEGQTRFNVRKALDPRCIVMHLKAGSKQAIIEELIDTLDAQGKLGGRDDAVAAVLEREQTMSTGMQHGIAIPHAKTDTVDRMVVAIGLKPEGVDFESIDGLPSQVFILVLSPARTTGPHIQFLAFVASVLGNTQAKDALLKCATPAEVFSFFTST
ncbi:MAG: sodium:proton exchanger [Chitinivibrionales bacterium]|nr:sodium:proton exchanger [Chitinivibrionales bacterium]MBD3396892.1 sodium:proton exchanger [Chitinivibrionales bacterium]